MSIDVVTFGCRLNSYESEVMKREAEAAGLRDAILINTCAVTAEAVRQARQSIRKARRENPEARIIVTGCAAQTEADTFAGMDEVDLVLGNTEKLERASYGRVAQFGIEESEKVRVNDIMSVRETAGHLIDGLEGRARAFVQVQNGCDHRCTFCIIPYGRGHSRSVPAGGVVDQVARLVGNGYREVVLTGVDLTSWGADLPGSPKLGRLVKAILSKVPGLDRLRLSSIDSIEADDALLDAIATEPRLMPHLHLSLQAGDDMILKRMKRRHLRDADAGHGRQGHVRIPRRLSVHNVMGRQRAVRQRVVAVHHARLGVRRRVPELGPQLCGRARHLVVARRPVREAVPALRRHVARGDALARPGGRVGRLLHRQEGGGDRATR